MKIAIIELVSGIKKISNTLRHYSNNSNTLSQTLDRQTLIRQTLDIIDKRQQTNDIIKASKVILRRTLDM